MSFFSITLTLFLIMNSAGSIEVFLQTIASIDAKRRAFVTMREMLIALAIMVAFHFFGELLLDLIAVGPNTVRIASGVILFLIASNMVFSTQRVVSPPSGEPFIVPIATPMIAGPPILATIMLYAYSELSMSKVLLAIVVAWLASLLVFLAAVLSKDRISDKVVSALQRLAGLVLIMMAVETTLEGIKQFMASGGSL